MIKWMPVAACLVLVMIASILVPHFLRTATIAESKYKYHVSEKERAIEWPWKYKTPAEKYPVVKFNGKQFIAKSQNSIHTEVMGEIIGSCVAEGLDPDTGKTYTETFEVRKIKGISEELMIAVGNEDGFYVYAADEAAAPDTLGKLLELYELSQNIELNYVTKCEGYEEKEELLLDNDEKIWQILLIVAMQRLMIQVISLKERIEDIWLLRQLLKHWVFITGWSTFLRMVTLLLIFLIMNIVILLEKRQQDRSSVIYKNIPRKQSPVPVCQHIRNCYRNWKWIHYG